MAEATKKIKVCYVLSYRSPNYIRTAVLLSALERISGVEVIRAVNDSAGIWRYPQTIFRLIRARIVDRPDVYILGFRGHEILGLVRILTAGKPLIFDEFINLDNWLVNEHQILKPDSLLSKLLRSYLAFFMARSQKILSDTKLHSQSSAKSYGLRVSKYETVYVGADESLFGPAAKSKKTKQFKVFFYGTLLPLHGVEIILGAAELLRSKPEIKFTIVGGSNQPARYEKLRSAVINKNLENVELVGWVPYDELPKMIADADLCLGGPFGNTPQSRLVISGKTYQFLAMAKPTVVGKIDEEVGFRDRRNVLLVEQGSSEALAKTVEWAAQHRAELFKIRERGRQLYQDRFSTDRIASQLQKLIEKVK